MFVRPRTFRVADRFNPLNLNFKDTTRPFDARITFTRNSPATYTDANGTLRSVAAGVPRANQYANHDPATLVCKGFQMEKAASNMVLNNSTSGAILGVIGSGGNWPSYMSQVNAAGLAREVVEISTIDGIPYVKTRHYGTATDTVVAAILSTSTTSVTASTGQIWTGSHYHAVQNNGGVAPGASLRSIVERSSIGGYLAQNDSANYTPATTLSRTSRGEHSVTLSHGSTARLSYQTHTFVTIGQVYDFFIYHALPQVEAGPGATSVILTTGTAVTRPIDNPIFTGTNLTSWFNETEGEIVIQYSVNFLDTVALGLFAWGDSTLSFASRTCAYASVNTSGANHLSSATAGAEQLTTPIPGSTTLDTSCRVAFGYASNTTRGAKDGTLGTHDTLCTPPSGLNALSIGCFTAGWVGANNSINGHIEEIRYFTRRGLDADMQARSMLAA